MSISNDIKKIGYMGAAGSFSEMAAEAYVSKEDLKDFELLPLISAENVLTSVEDGSLDIGIFPIENSNGGIVVEAVYGMAKHVFDIATMFEIDIHHNVMVKPGVKREDITVITSHDQALKQCRHYLRRQWADADIEEYADTAKAAEDLAAGVLDAFTAVIAPKRSAELYGLEILEESVQDLKYNYTMFVAATQLET